MNYVYLFLLVSPIFLYILFWIYAIKRGWRNIRLLSASTTVCFSIFSYILWAGTDELWILKTSMGFALFFGISILSWPITAKDIVEKIGFKW